VPLPPPPAENGTQERSDKPRGTGGVCLHLVFVGLVAAATVMMFSIASVSLLYCKGPITRSRIGSTSLPYNDPHAGAISAEPSPPILDSPKVLSAAAQIPSIDETTELTGAKPSIEPPAYRRDVSATPSETPDAFAVWNPSGSDTIRPTEADGSGPLAREPLRPAEASVKPDASTRTRLSASVLAPAMFLCLLISVFYDLATAGPINCGFPAGAELTRRAAHRGRNGLPRCASSTFLPRRRMRTARAAAAFRRRAARKII